MLPYLLLTKYLYKQKKVGATINANQNVEILQVKKNGTTNTIISSNVKTDIFFGSLSGLGNFGTTTFIIRLQPLRPR